MAEFRNMVREFLMSKIGPGDHSTIVANVMDAADVNKDSKVLLRPFVTFLSEYLQIFMNI